MQGRFIARIAAELNVPASKLAATAKLLAGGGTVPLLARYRNEATGSLDEVAITAVRDRMTQLIELEQRREAIVKSLVKRTLLTDSLKVSIASADLLSALEDLYAPFRPKRRTRATITKKAGLEPLADQLFDQQATVDPPAAAAGSESRDRMRWGSKLWRSFRTPAVASLNVRTEVSIHAADGLRFTAAP
jgi:uncharacterized protein